MRARAFLLRAVVALMAVGLLVGTAIGVNAAQSATGTQAPVAQALPPVAIDGSLNTDPASVPEDAVAPVKAPLPPQNAIVPSPPTTAATPSPVPTSAEPTVAPVSPSEETSAAPRSTPAPGGASEPGRLAPYAAWANSLSKVMDVPARALQAYAYAQNAVDNETPGCHLSWTTLAGIAHIESNHGRFGGRALQSDGRPSRPIIGIPLDGGPKVEAIGDSDGGSLDGDTVWDRAVGPFQFIPTSWAKWRADANGDGVADPQSIDDAAVAAGRYLCSGGKNLTDGASWWRAILSYNNSNAYVQDVFDGADSYARAARR